MVLVINGLLFAVALYMLWKMLNMNKRNKKAKVIIDIVNSVEEKEIFYEKADAMIHGDDIEFSNKAKVVKLWGMAYHNDLKHFNEVLNDIQIDFLIGEKKGKADIEPDEDSFFYLYLAIENMLEGIKRRDLRKLIDSKMQAYDEKLNDQFCKNLHDALTSFYDETGDRGLAFYEKVLSGDYGDYRYARSMIGLYKSIANAHAAVLYKENGNTEKYNECVPFLENFMEYGVGQRWLKVLKITLPKKEEEKNEDIETFTMTKEGKNNQ